MIDPIYFTDDYPREGCIATVDVTQRGFGLDIFAPNGARMESYALVKSHAAIVRMLKEWASGKKPRLHAEGD